MFAFKGGKNFTKGNSVTLLQDGDEFYPQIIRRIKHARSEILLETFILANDRIGLVLAKALIAAARRGVSVCVTVDSYGSFYLPQDYIQRLTEAGVVFQIYDPQPRWFSFRPKVFRRLHRKLAVIDQIYGFVGGINFSLDHMSTNEHGKRDYAVELRGPVVAEIRALCCHNVRDVPGIDCDVQAKSVAVDEVALKATFKDAEVAFISRDNRRNRSEIEKAYLAEIHRAQSSVTIANAYFFPGYRIIRAMRKASERGVRVRLILQGDPDIPMALLAAQCLYGYLLHHNIEIYEYIEQPLHAKIATVDSEWSTVGSSNLDPWSLAMNLEANVFIKHRDFNRQLNGKMQALIQKSTHVKPESIEHRDGWTQLRNTLLYHVLRHLPSIVKWLPNIKPRIERFRSIFNKNRVTAAGAKSQHIEPNAAQGNGGVKSEYRDTGDH